MSTKTIASDPSVPPAPIALQNGPSRRFHWGLLVGVVLAVVCLPFLLTFPEGQRGLLAFSVAGTLFFLLKRSPGLGVAASLGYLALVGGLRRWLLPVSDAAGTDPLLVAAPAAALAFLMITRHTTPKTRLMRLLTGLMVLMAIEIVNPLQGGLAVGVAGTLFYIGPLLWYFVGRQIGTSTVLRHVFRAVILVAIAAALYGLYQTYFGFNLGERMWIRNLGSGYSALHVTSSVTRAFSFFTSSQEYTEFLVVGIVMLWILFLRGRWVALVPIPLLAIALFLGTARGPIVTTLLSCVILWALQGRSRQEWGPRLVMAAIVAVVGLTMGLRHLQDASFSGGTQALVQHQVGGLLNPLDSQKSTATGHVGMVLDGIINGFRTPTGLGLGATTLAGDKFAGSSDNSEGDISNMFLSLGFIGGLLYIGVIVIVLTMALRYWQKTRSFAALGMMGIIFALFGGWLSGGAYSTSMLAWFCIGSLDRLQLEGVPSLAARQRPVTRKTQPFLQETVR